MEIFQKCLKDMENFRYLDRNGDFRKFWTKSRFFSKSIDKIDNFDENQDLPRFWPISRFLENFDQSVDFSKILTEIELFVNLD